MNRPLADYGRILVIKLGALGDFVQAMRAMAEIRRAHPKASITLLTTPPFTAFAQASGLFDGVEGDGRPRGLIAELALLRRLRRARYERVYDLQTSSRTRNYFYAFWPSPPEWSGISLGASHRHANPKRNQLQNLDRLWDQLHAAGIVEPMAPGAAPGPDLSWAAHHGKAGPSAAARFGIEGPFALLAPGASHGRPKKRWPLQRFIHLAKALEAMGLTPVVLGSGHEDPLGEAIRLHAPSAILLTGRTSLTDVAALGAEAALMIGNDTGPTHLAAFSGAPTVVLFSGDSDPDLCAPRTDKVVVLRRDDLAELLPDDVTIACRVLLGCA